MLSAGFDEVKFENIPNQAYKAGASGFLAGQAIWLDAFKAFPDREVIRRALKQDAIPYLSDHNKMTHRESQPWRYYPVHGDGGAGIGHPDATFRIHYSGFGKA